eukprot:CAMPEP_0201550734 /NCGR_PEP_ID=MMETSP0173_2-20130828/7046_1 /ASSEMBLY_ACC=CAM_ASM_000268 /TAXON_ID=218659 /ORGANISM="Vexillifera sp., Strain DIVA3 564/2" /LENGTH=287 /DNA_ID=CAMNT_0047960799 /DNA_START=89 /DNA_END=952 /DNA_ORIENTATION=-
MGNAQVSSKVRKLAQKGDEPGLRKILSKASGSNPTQVLDVGDPSDGNTALHYAVEEGYSSIVQLLVENGASATVTNIEEESALTLAARKGRTDLLKTLINNNKEVLRKEPLPLNAAAAAGDVECVQFLIEQGADPSECDSRGQNALIHAVVKMNQDVVVELLKGGADPNEGAILPRAKTPLIAASSKSYGSPKIVQLLVEAGAKVNNATDDQWTALHQAVADGQPRIMQILMDSGADPKAEASNGKTPESIAKEHYLDSKSIVHALLRGEKIDMKEEEEVWAQVNRQ